MRFRGQQHRLPRGSRVPELRDSSLLQFSGSGDPGLEPPDVMAGISVCGIGSVGRRFLLPKFAHHFKDFTVKIKILSD